MQRDKQYTSVNMCSVHVPIPATNIWRQVHDFRLNQQIWLQTLKLNLLCHSYSVDQITSTEIPKLSMDTKK